MRKFVVNAFTNTATGGNPASVCILDQWVDDAALQEVAAQHGLPATSFIVKKDDYFQIRWFAPEYEIDLCGHGAIAAGFILFTYIKKEADIIKFNHPSYPVLTIKRIKKLYQLELPIKNVSPLPNNRLYEDAVGIKLEELYQYNNERILIVLNSKNEIAKLNPSLQNLRKISHRGIIVTAKGDNSDFVYRVFYPGKSLYEDQATGSAHCYLIPYWAHKLDKKSFHAQQLSRRGGEMWANLMNDKILLSGQAFEVKGK